MKKFQDYKETTIFEFKNFSEKDRDAYFVEANKFFKKYLYTKKVPGHLDNEDIIQDAFVTLCVTDAKNETGKVNTFLFMIIERNLISYSKREVIAMKYARRELSGKPSLEEEEDDDGSRLKVAQAKLDSIKNKKHVEIYKMKVMQSMTVKEIMQEVGMSEGGINRALNTVRNHLREMKKG